MFDYIPIKIDINDPIGEIVARQYDHKSRFIKIQFIDKDLGNNIPINLTGCQARMFVKTSEINGILFDGNILDGLNGIVTFLIPNSVTQSIGIFPCEIQLSNPNDKSLISTKSFTLKIEESIYDDSFVEDNGDLSSLQQALADTGEFNNRLTATEQKMHVLLDQHIFAKPLYLGESIGFAVQGITHLKDNQYILTLSSTSNSSDTLICLFDSENGITASAEGHYGHGNSIAKDENDVFYIPTGYGGIYRFTMEIDIINSSISIIPMSSMTFSSNIKVWNVFDYNGSVYAYGSKNSKACIWEITQNQPEYYYIVFPSNTYITLPNEAPRTNQTWGTDGTYLYWLRSNPNAIAVFDFNTGIFIRWVDVGDYIDGSMLLGEVESICVVNNQLKLISQYYYPNAQNTLKRFWLFSELKWATELPPDQQHWYPNEHRTIYVSNGLLKKVSDNIFNGITIRTNQGDIYPKNTQTGSQEFPYPSLETALYAAMATPDIPSQIVLLKTDIDYNIDDLVFRTPSMTIIINCLGKTTFEYIHLPAGNLSITGNAFIKRISTTNRARLQIVGGTFISKHRIDNAAPYVFGGIINIINGKWFNDPNVTEDEILFEFNTGTTGVVGFDVTSVDNNNNILTDFENGILSMPMSNNYQQLNIILYNIKNYGKRQRWTSIYSNGQNDLQIGANITLTIPGFYLNDNTVYRIKWRAENDAKFYNTIVHVNGETVADLSSIINKNTLPTLRTIKISFNPSSLSNKIRIDEVIDYSILNNSIFPRILTSGNLPSGIEISQIAVQGY